MVPSSGGPSPSASGGEFAIVKRFLTHDRAQAWTIDALLMIGLMVGGIVYALQVVPIHDDRAVTEELIEAQLEQDATDLLAVAGATGDLRDAVVYWNDSAGRWVDAGRDGGYVRPPAGHPLGDPLAGFEARGIGYNIEVVYRTPTGDSASHRMYYQGTPGAHAVVASATVVVSDDTILRNQSENTTLEHARTFYAPDAFPDGPEYAVLRVRIIAWRS